jgi:hypothetical protein
MSWSLVQGFLPSVKKIMKLKSRGSEKKNIYTYTDLKQVCVCVYEDQGVTEDFVSYILNRM